MPKLSDGRVALLEDGDPLTVDNADQVPSYLDIAEVTKGHDLRNTLDPVFNSIRTLCQDVEDTETIAGAELYNAIRAFHLNAKEAAKRGVTTAQAVVDVAQVFKSVLRAGGIEAAESQGDGSTPPQFRIQLR